MRSSNQIEKEMDQLRDELTETVSQLMDQVSPKANVDRAKTAVIEKAVNLQETAAEKAAVWQDIATQKLGEFQVVASEKLGTVQTLAEEQLKLRRTQAQQLWDKAKERDPQACAVLGGVAAGSLLVGGLILRRVFR